MPVILADHAGFCNGVRRAMDLALAAGSTAQAEGMPICTLGELIHNNEALKKLRSRGIRQVNSVEEAEAGYLILRSHGEPPETYEKAAARGLRVIDCTCPSVKHLHDLVRAHTEQGNSVILVGDEGHPEVVATAGWCRKGRCWRIGSVEEAEALPEMQNALLVCQTTFSRALWTSVRDTLTARFPDLTVKDTICNATALRQKEAEALSKRCQAMIVVGGRQSANTRKLYDICLKNCPKSILVERAEEIPPRLIDTHNILLGITAGASTPDWSLKEVFTHMTDMEEKLAQEVKEELSFEEQLMADIEASMVRIHNGQTMTGTVVQVTDSEVCVNIGYKADGIIKKEDLVDKDVQLGDTIEVEVVKVNDGEGNVLLSQRNIINKKVWEDLMAKYQAGEYIEATGKEAVKGGLIATVDGGIRCFVPASQLAQRYVEKIDQFVGQPMKLKIIEVDEKKKRIVASRKVVVAEENATKKAAAWEKLEEGATVTGIVRRFADFGAFVDLGGVDGLIHVTDMAWHRVNKPEEVLKIGDEVQVKVKGLDRERERIQLSLKDLQAKPWDNIEEKYPVGSIIERKVVRIREFGAFVALEPGVDGLVHISQCALTHVDKVEDALTVGQMVTVKVLAVDPEAKRITLSVKEALADQSAPDEEVADMVIPGEDEA